MWNIIYSHSFKVKCKRSSTHCNWLWKKQDVISSVYHLGLYFPSFFSGNHANCFVKDSSYNWVGISYLKSHIEILLSLFWKQFCKNFSPRCRILPEVFGFTCCLYCCLNDQILRENTINVMINKAIDIYIFCESWLKIVHFSNYFKTFFFSSAIVGTELLVSWIRWQVHYDSNTSSFLEDILKIIYNWVKSIGTHYTYVERNEPQNKHPES